METRTRHKKEAWLDPATQISVVRRQVGKPVSMHLHEYYELEIILGGSGLQNLNGSVYPIGPGTVYFLTPIDFHAITPTDELDILNVAFAENLLSPVLQLHFMNRRDDLIFSSQEEANGMAMLIERLDGECRREDQFSSDARSQLLSLLMYPIARSMNAGRPPARAESQQLEDSMRYLFRHFREDISLAQIAEKSGYTPNYFSYLFHASCGIRFMDFLTRLRINYARSALLTTTLSVSQIAQSSGFSSSSNFFRAFRKETGLSPEIYRKTRQ